MTDREILQAFEAPAGAELIKAYKNGNIQIAQTCDCPRCGGKGIYYIGVHNGHPVPSYVDGGVCFQCNGTGKARETVILMTAENRAKADAQARKRAEKREAEQAQRQAEIEAREQARREAQAQREAEIAAEKANSQYFGEVGQRVSLSLDLIASPSWEQKTFAGFGTETMYCHIFKDAEGHKFTWKTASTVYIPDGKGQYIVAEPGDHVEITGTIKEHSDYKDEKQTILTRCKVKSIEARKE